MKIIAPPIIDPDSADIDYKNLDELARFVTSEDFEDDIKQDALRVINCLKYIKANTSFIKFFIENRDAICRQHQSGNIFYDNGDPLLLSKEDRRHGVIRDKNGTSMHFNRYDDPNLAASALIEHVTIFEDDASYMRSVGHLNLFVRCFEYDAEKGCIEARTSRSMDMAEMIRQNNGKVTLDILMHSLSLTAGFNDEFLTAHEKRKVAHRFTEKYLSDTITKQAIDSYLTDIMAIDFSEEDDSEEMLVDHAQYLSFKEKSTAIVLGRTGTMVHHYFASGSVADQFVNFVRSSLRHVAGVRRVKKILSSLGENTYYLVRLSQLQYRMISGDDSEPLLSITQYLAQKKSEAENEIKLKILGIRERIMNAPDIGCSEGMSTYDGKVLPSCMRDIVKNIDEAIMQPSLLRYQKAFDSSSALPSALFSREAAGNTVLHRACFENQGEALDVIIPTLSREDLDKHFLLRNKNGETFLYVLLDQGVTYKRLLAIVDQCSVPVYNKFLLIFTNGKESFLHLAAKKCKPDVFKILLQKASDDALSTLAPEKNHEKYSLLEVILDHQAESNIEIFIRRISARRLSIAMFNSLHLMQDIARNHSPRIIKVLFDCISDWPLQDLLLYNPFGQNALDVFVREQGWYEVLLLLNRLSDKNIIRAIEQGNRQYILRALFNIIHDYQGWDLFPEFRERLMLILNRSCFKESLVSFAVDRFINKGKSLYQNSSWLMLLQPDEPSMWDLKRMTLASCIAKTLEKSVLNIRVLLHDVSAQRREVSLLSLSRFHSIEMQPIQSLLLGNGESLYLGSISENDLCQKIWEHGFASWLEYRSILAQYKMTCVHTVMLILYKLDAVLIGVGGAFPDNLIHITNMVHQISQSDNFLIKTIKPANLDDFVRQLEGGYEYRPQLRSEDSKKDATHKFYHLQGKVGPYSTVKVLKPITATRKMAMTWVSKNLDTHLFQQQHRHRLLVGVGLDRSFCEIKAMLFSDRGTYQRGWVGSLYAVSQYANKMAHINFTDIDEFIRAISEPDAGINEVLAKITREALQCVVIGRDTSEARKTACDYRQKIKDGLGIELPIIFYDPHLQSLIPFDMDFYTTCEHRIEEKREREKEESAKERLLQIRIELTNYKNWRPGIFSRPVLYGRELMPKRIYEVIELIDSAFENGFQFTLIKVLEVLKIFKHPIARGSHGAKELMSDLLQQHRPASGF